MSSLKTPLLLLTAVAALAFSGCGDANPTAKRLIHTDTWSTDHKTVAKAKQESCFECHGNELDGGISKVGCVSCHKSIAKTNHPLEMGSFAYARHAKYKDNTSSCATAVCHGVDLNGVNGKGSCTSCHLGGIDHIHPTDWTTNGTISSHPAYVNNNDTTSCKTDVCHGNNLKGVFLSGPACDSCHAMPQ